MHPSVPFSSLCLLALVSSAQAGPLTTVPWNGHTGAVSFTYDDARKSQIPTLLPQLDALSIKATFFLTYGAGGDLSTNKAAWIQAAKNGHELANHTYDHQNVAAGTTQIQKMASDLRGFDPVVDAVTFAYPNCSVGAPTEVNAEAFMGRGCGQANYSWTTQPSDWKNVQGLILNSGAPGPGVTLINSAKSGNSWGITIVHDVTASPDQYSLTPADNKKMLDAAIANNVWIAPYGTVGAYYRAHFTMDAVTVTGSSPWNLAWTSPHAKMPKSVMLKVKLAAATFGNAFTVTQGGAAIPVNADGSYTIDFMKLKMTVTSGSSGVLAHGSLPATVGMAMVGSKLVLSGLPVGSYRLDLRSLSGTLLSHSILDATGSQDLAVIAPVHARRVVAMLRSQDGNTLETPLWMP